MIPKGLATRHFKLAAREIDEFGIPAGRDSTRYELVIDGKPYPPKLIISIATKHLSGKEFAASAFNAVEAKNYFIHRDFTILDKKRNQLLGRLLDEDEESAFPEGKAEYRKHLARERDTVLSRKAKARRFAATRDLACDVCGFSFVKKYGALAIGYIEAHHTTHVSKLKGTTNTKLSELALVCSNCHRMLHRSRTGLSVAALKSIVNRAEKRGPSVVLRK